MLGVDDKELGKRGDFDASAISHARYGRRGIGPKAVKGIARGLGVPACAVKAKDALVTYMDKIIEGYLAFMAQESDVVVSSKFETARTLLTLYLSELAALSGPSPTPTPTP